MRVSGESHVICFREHDPKSGTFVNQEGTLSYAESQGITFSSKVEDGDIHRSTWRMLSETIVGSGSYKATDFTQGNVIRNAVDKFNGKPLFRDHWPETGKELGLTSNAYYQPAKEENGQIIPGGVNAIYSIDTGKPEGWEIARSLNFPEGPTLRSTSVGIRFKWEASHEFEHEWDFYDSIGTIGADGEEVRRICTEIVRIDEASFVFLGADPFAKIQAADSASFSKYAPPAKGKTEKPRNYFVFDMPKESRDRMDKLEMQYFNASNEPRTNKHTPMKGVIQMFGLSGLSAPEGDNADYTGFRVVPKEQYDSYKQADNKLIEATAKLSKATDDLEEANQELAKFKQEAEDFKKEVEALKPDAEAFKAAKATIEFAEAELKQMRDEAVEVYRKAVGDSAKEVKVNYLQSLTDREALAAEIESYGGNVAMKYGAYCKNCESDDISFRRSQPSDPNPHKEGGQGSAILDNLIN